MLEKNRCFSTFFVYKLCRNRCVSVVLGGRFKKNVVVGRGCRIWVGGDEKIFFGRGKHQRFRYFPYVGYQKFSYLCKIELRIMESCKEMCFSFLGGIVAIRPCARLQTTVLQ